MKSHVGVVSFLIFLLIHTRYCADYLFGLKLCPKCPAGSRVYKHCTVFNSTSCLPCDSGTYMDEPTGRTLCLRCRICDSGSGLKVKAPCSSTSNTVCEPEAGYFCVGPLEEGSCGASQRHKLCQPGHYIKQPGSASADTQFSPCSEGTFSDGTVFSCQTHTLCEQNDKVTVKAGTSDSDTECEERGPNYMVIVGGVMAVLIIAMISAALIFYVKKIKSGQKRTEGPRDEHKLSEVQNLNNSNQDKQRLC